MFQGGHYEGIRIKERKRILEEIYKRFYRKLEHRRQQLNLSLEFYRLVEQVILAFLEDNVLKITGHMLRCDQAICLIRPKLGNVFSE